MTTYQATNPLPDLTLTPLTALTCYATKIADAFQLMMPDGSTVQGAAGDYLVLPPREHLMRVAHGPTFELLMGVS